MFRGLSSAWGTYDKKTGKYWQVKQPVTRTVILDHLKGAQSYGFYLLDGDRTYVSVADFDTQDSSLPIQFQSVSSNHGLNTYIERSKSKGYHVWMFFDQDGIQAYKARLAVQFLLDQINSPETETFPKQDQIDSQNSYGNFINAPLFGSLVPYGKTVFVNPERRLLPYENQWSLLQSVARIEDSIIDGIISDNQLEKNRDQSSISINNPVALKGKYYPLPVCIRRVLENGVTFNQRIAAFRLAVHLKRIGLPQDQTIAALETWKERNKPRDGKRIITTEEIIEQTDWAYRGIYTGYGCQEEVINTFCSSNCPVNINRR